MFSCTVVIDKDNVFRLRRDKPAQKEFCMALGDEWPDLLTVREVAKILRVSPLTIKRWGKRGKLPAIRINSRGDRRYKKEAVLWLLGQQQKGAV
mgnify:FL=1